MQAEGSHRFPDPDRRRQNAEGESQEKLFQLNAGNANALEEAYGDDSNWIKKEMVCILIPDSKSKQGKRAVLSAPMNTVLNEATK